MKNPFSLDLYASADRSVAIASIASSLLAIGLIDHYTTRDWSLEVCYLVPIAVASWHVGKHSGLLVAWVSAIVVFLVNEVWSPTPVPLAAWWNGAGLTAFYGSAAWVLASLREAIDKERILSRTDELTGTSNRRHFHELLEMEIRRCRRYGHPFTIAMLDLDNFKTVNDTFGHKVGDDTLRLTVTLLKAHLRETDIVGRIGGDEFAVLMAETDEEGAQSLLGKLPEILAKAFRSRNLKVTGSMGCLTVEPPARMSADELLEAVDQLMYTIKHEDKSGIHFGLLRDTLPGVAPPDALQGTGT